MRVEHRPQLQAFRPIAGCDRDIAAAAVVTDRRRNKPAVGREHGLDRYPSGLRIDREEYAVGTPCVGRLHGHKGVERRKQPPHHHRHQAAQRAYGELLHQAEACARPVRVSTAEARAKAAPETTEAAA